VEIGVKTGQWGWTFPELLASWEAAEEAGFDILASFDHVTAAPEGVPAWEATTLLSVMAARTKRIQLGLYVVNVSLRHPFLLAAQIAVAQAASNGRVEVGLGAGSHYFARYDHEVTGIPFPRFPDRMKRLEACSRVLPALWRGEEVTDEGLGLRGASLGPIAIEPPRIAVGGESDRALEIAARYAHGWHAPGVEPERFAELAGKLDELCRSVGRTASIRKSIQRRCDDPDEAAEYLAGYKRADADAVIFVLDKARGPDAVRRLAEAVLSP